MGRTIGAVIVGYLIMFVVVFGGLTAAYMAIGADRAFQAGTYDVSGLWIGVMSAVGLIAAMAGGWVCATIAGRGGVKALAGLVLILGILFAIPVLFASPNAEKKVRPADVSMMTAMSESQQPAWAAILNPVLGVVGVMIGGKRKNLAARNY